MKEPAYPFSHWSRRRIANQKAEDRQRARTPWLVIGGAVIVASVVFVLKLFPR